MEISRKRFALIIGLSVLLTFTVTYGWQYGGFQRHHSPQASANVYVFKETPEGVDQIYAGNAITDIGEDYMRDMFGWDNISTFNATQWIALGNSTIDQTNTKLDTEATSTGFTRAANDSCVGWTNSGDYAYNVTKKFTATGNIAVNATSLHWAPASDTDNNCFALAYLGAMESFQNNWNCTIVWVITWNAN